MKDHDIVPLKNIGVFKNENTSTFSIQRDCWTNNFNDGVLAPNQRNVIENRIYTAGCYCFWWIGSANSLNKYNAQHYIKGKETNLSDKRIRSSSAKVVRSDWRKDGLRRQSPVHYLYHPINWTFHEIEVDKSLYVPLYVGKSAHIYDRITSHLRWASEVEMIDVVDVAKFLENDDVSYTRETLRRIRKPPKNTVAQFRAGFKFLREQARENGPADIILNEKIGLSIYKNTFDAVEQRFFMEGKLIDNLRPPFNVDSER